MLNANDRSALLDQLRKRNLNETERFLKLIKSRNTHSLNSARLLGLFKSSHIFSFAHIRE
jgi:hypothetical protein